MPGGRRAQSSDLCAHSLKVLFRPLALHTTDLSFSSPVSSSPEFQDGQNTCSKPPLFWRTDTSDSTRPSRTLNFIQAASSLPSSSQEEASPFSSARSLAVILETFHFLTFHFLFSSMSCWLFLPIKSGVRPLVITNTIIMLVQASSSHLSHCSHLLTKSPASARVPHPVPTADSPHST